MLSKVLSKLSPNKQKALRNVLWAMLGKVVTMLGALFVGILVARYLGPSQYGLMNYVISFVTLFSVLATLGLDNIVIRELAANPEQNNEIMGSSFLARLCLSGLAYVFSISIAFFSHADSNTIIVIAIYSLYLFTIPFNTIRNYFTSIVKNEYVVKSEISRTLIGAVIKIVLLWMKAPLIYFIAATAFDFYLVAGGYIISYKKIVGSIRTWRYSKKTMVYLCKESFPLALSASAIIIYQKIDQVMIKNMLNDSSVGYFATAAIFLGVISFLPDVISQTITPILVKMKKENETQYNLNTQKFFGITVWCAILMALVTCLISYWVIRYTYGLKYIAAVPVLQVLVWKTVGGALSSSSGHIIVLEHLQKYAFFRNIIGTVICVILNFIFIPKWGIIGSAWVAVITMMFTGFLSHFFIPPYRKYFRMQVKALLFGWKDLFELKNMMKGK